MLGWFFVVLFCVFDLLDSPFVWSLLVVFFFLSLMLVFYGCCNVCVLDFV